VPMSAHDWRNATQRNATQPALGSGPASQAVSAWDASSIQAAVRSEAGLIFMAGGVAR
jgi:hypothetical protein